ncbi:MAG: hypothetical protein KAU62_05115 [Candidatus Heimdallarchaeota archaeon]|nr:hypothetical protein [Candidatus Heimdallarchaeota archaeon]MCG3255445.1 hypothetical protein [Candidatus Heimdallarchaeota archaeon]MCK4610519.1 hypothetical protein [Candidatus Heimdallarchaeota archaeon]
MFFLRRVYKSIIGFITCTIVVVLLMLVLWPTLGIEALDIANAALVADHGSGGHFWLMLLILLVVNIFIKMNLPIPIPILETYGLDNTLGNGGVYVLILVIWLIGSFVGGLVSRGGLRSGAWSAMLSFLFLDFIFATMTSSFFGSGGLFFSTFFATLILGSFIFVPLIGLVGGITGGILGKMLFTKSKDKKKDPEE